MSHKMTGLSNYVCKLIGLMRLTDIQIKEILDWVVR
jgi:hypothetical protein